MRYIKAKIKMVKSDYGNHTLSFTGLPHKGHKQVADIERNALSYMYIANSPCAIAQQSKVGT